MEIVIVAGGMPFGPNTLRRKSLGGSETAVINIATELNKLGNIVTVFCPLDEAPGIYENIRWEHLDTYPEFIPHTEIDLLVVSRSAELFRHPHQAKKAVLWVHDLATYTYTTPTVLPANLFFNEVWCVSEFHRQQWHKITGYPLDRIRATRNGITRVETMDMGRINKQLLYAARPERGLENLVKPGGIMSMLPEFTLKVTMYDHKPPQMMDYYRKLWHWASLLPNVEMVPPLTQPELRQLMRNSWAYVYPTDFEEVSCIIAREAISVGLPFICTDKGALRETLGDCGIFIAAENVGSKEWCEDFAAVVKAQDDNLLDVSRNLMAARTDLYWEDVAKQWVEWSAPVKPGDFSLAWSLMEDSDIVAAKAFIESLENPSKAVLKLQEQIIDLYPYLYGRETLEQYYERYFVREDEKGARRHPSMEGTPRFEAIAAQVEQLPKGAFVLDYGCAEGVIILDLAKRFPDKFFVGIDHAKTNIDLCYKYMNERGLNNCSFIHGNSEANVEFGDMVFDAVIASEVLEHVEKPWEIASWCEGKVKLGGRVIITVPSGPWEATGLYDRDQWHWRAHIWHIDKWMLRHMFAEKDKCVMQSIAHGQFNDGRNLGHLLFSYEVDHKPVKAIDPLEKAKSHRARQTVSAAIIAMNNADTIQRCLNSISSQVQQVKIALGPSNDLTNHLIIDWAVRNPWIQVIVEDVPKIEAEKFGFDDARNRSVEGLEGDWIFWIDTDEYLSGNIKHLLRDNAVDSISIHQHHFSCDPRGGPTQIDKPARLYRNNGTFKFYGKVHEHAEKGYNNGPAFTYFTGDADIGHIGYVNESVRRKRFERNYPLLVWDRKVYPDRNIGNYLWLRDIIHTMRYAVEQQNVERARQLAEEAIAFYRKTWKTAVAFGMGGLNALAYYGEALAFLGRGTQIAAQFQIDPNPQIPPVQIVGQFESIEEFAKLVEDSFKPEFEKRNSGYWK